MRQILTAAACLFALAAPAWAVRDDITIGMVLEPPNLDPTAGAAAAIDEIVYANLFEGLTRFGPDGSLRPALAKSWDVSDDARTYTFHLRDNVTFHDGATFDAGDVVFSLDRARADDSVNAQKALFANITSVEAPDPLNVRVTLAKPDGAFAWKMAWGDAVMVDPASAATNATHPVGTGPFRFDQWRQGDRVSLRAYDKYWGKAPAIKSASFRFISDPNAAFSAMMAGDVDAFPNYPAPETLIQIRADPRFQVINGTTEGETILAMNNTAPGLSDPRVRAAIAHAINRDDIINGAMFGYGTPIGSHFAPHHPDYVDLTALSKYDPDQSRDLLVRADMNKLTLRMALPPTPYARRSGEIIASQLRAVGISTQITNMEWAQWLETVFKGGDFDLTIVSHTEPMDIGIYARPDYYFHYDNPAFKALMDRLDVQTDADARRDLLQQAQQVIAEDHVNAFLFQLAKTGVADAALTGFWANAPIQANDLTDVRWTE